MSTQVPANVDPWEPRQALLIGNNPEIELVLQQLLWRNQWKLTMRTTDPLEAQKQLRLGQSNLLIIDDSPQQSSILSLAFFQQVLLGIATPTICLLHEGRNRDASILEPFGICHVLMKPLSPDRFQPVLVNLFKVWNSPGHRLLRGAALAYLRGHQQQCFDILPKLLTIGGVDSQAAKLLACIYDEQGKVKDAEKILLSAVKLQPNHVGNILALANFYLMHSMPTTAIKILEKLMAKYGRSWLFRLPLLQALLFLGDQVEAVNLLNQMIAEEFSTDSATAILSSVFMAQGQQGEAEILWKNVPRLTGQELWYRAESAVRAG